jgi:MFS family permease
MIKENNRVNENEIEDLKQAEDKKAKKSFEFPKYLIINYVCICVFAFLMGTDFAVIIPTLWDRLKSMDSSGSFMGLIISSYSITGVLSGLIMGYISDEVKKTKIFFLLSIFFAFSGHLIYFAGTNQYFLLLARTISGMCMGAGTVALAYIAKTTKEKDRTSLIACVMATRQFGLMIGPAFNFFLMKLDFKLFDQFVVDRKSSPGLLMAFLWFISFIIILIFYTDNNKNKKSESTETKDEKTEFLNEEQEKVQIVQLTLDKKNKEFFRLEIFVLLLVTFFTYFNQTSLETIVTPFTELMFGWGEIENSLLFCIGGFIIIISYVLIKILSTKFPDRFILLAGIICILTGLIIGCVCLPFAKQLQNPQISHLRNNKNKFIKLDSILANMSAYKKEDVLLNKTISLDDFMFSESFLDLSMNISQIKKIVLNSNNNSLFFQKPVYDYRFFPAFVCFVLLDVLGLPAIAITSASLFTKVSYIMYN